MLPCSYPISTLYLLWRTTYLASSPKLRPSQRMTFLGNLNLIWNKQLKLLAFSLWASSLRKNQFTKECLLLSFTKSGILQMLSVLKILRTIGIYFTLLRELIRITSCKMPLIIFKGHLLNLKEWSPYKDMSKTQFWVQLHGLPPLIVSPENIKLIGEHMGRLIEIEPIPLGIACKKFMRIRVELEAGNSLKTGFLFPSMNKPPAQISSKYEKLSDFCYHCGRLGHTLESCGLLKTQFEVHYGPELRVDPRDNRFFPKPSSDSTTKTTSNSVSYLQRLNSFYTSSMSPTSTSRTNHELTIHSGSAFPKQKQKYSLLRNTGIKIPSFLIKLS